jgi:uncharacterized protein YjaZ
MGKLFDTMLYLEDFKSKEEVVETIIEMVEQQDKENYAGYGDKKALKDFLTWAIFGRERGKKFDFCYNLKYKNKIEQIINEVVEKCSAFIGRKLSINIFPSLDSFTLNEIGGCAGFCPAKNTIVILINFVNGWETPLKEALVHELAHAISNYYNELNNSLSESLVLDGIAEHFREAVIGGERAPWTLALTKKEAFDLLCKIENILKIRDSNIWQDLFFGGNKYPKWAGYSIGYYLIRDYLKKQKEINWKFILEKNPEEIFKESIKIVKVKNS